jgi:hypothetical protein
MDLQYWQDLLMMAAAGAVGGAIYWGVNRLDAALARVWPDRQVTRKQR